MTRLFGTEENFLLSFVVICSTKFHKIICSMNFRNSGVEYVKQNLVLIDENEFIGLKSV